MLRSVVSTGQIGRQDSSCEPVTYQRDDYECRAV